MGLRDLYLDTLYETKFQTFPPHKAPSEERGSQTDIQLPQIHLADNIWAAEMFGLPSTRPSYSILQLEQ